MDKLPNIPWWASMGFHRPAPDPDTDYADMGTAFGLDAITTLEPESHGESPLGDDAPPPSRFELRLHRRSTL